MLICINDQMVKLLMEKGDALPPTIKDALQNLINGFVERKLYIHANRTFWTWISSQDFLSSKGKNLCSKMKNKITQLGALFDDLFGSKKLLISYVEICSLDICTVEYGDFNGLLVIKLSILFFENTSSIQRFRFVCENYNDVNFYISYSKLYGAMFLINNNHNKNFFIFDSFDCEGGGGTSIKDVFNNLAQASNKKILAIVDSDRTGPDLVKGREKAYGKSTFKHVKNFCCNQRLYSIKDIASKLNCMNSSDDTVALLFVLNEFSEAENTMHYDMLRCLISHGFLSSDKYKKSLDNISDKITEDLDSYWRFLDLKLGMNRARFFDSFDFWNGVVDDFVCSPCLKEGLCLSVKDKCDVKSALKIDSDMLVEISEKLKLIVERMWGSDELSEDFKCFLEDVRGFFDHDRFQVDVIRSWSELVFILRMVLSFGFALDVSLQVAD